MKAQIKGFSMVCMAALLLLAASCKKETKEETEYEGGFTAKTEAQQNDSKVYLVGTGLEWNATESILVYNSDGTGQKFTSYKVYIDEANFKPDFDGEDKPDNFDRDFYTGGYTAYYPHDNMTNNSGTVTFTMPATQAYTVCHDHVTFDHNAFPMAGQTATGTADDRFIHFKNLCGLLELDLFCSEPRIVDNIVLTSPTDMLNGTGTVSFPSKDDDPDDAPIPTLSALTGGTKTLTLDCSSFNVTLGTEHKKFYFVVPAGTLGSGFTVKVTDPDGYTWERKATGSANQIERNKMTQMPPIEVTFTPSSTFVTPNFGGGSWGGN